MDCISDKIFKNKKFDKVKLLKFGFAQRKNAEKCTFYYNKKILDDQFDLIVSVYGEKNVDAKLVDSSTNDEYTLHLMDDAQGTFVGEVRMAYENALKIIAEKCCNTTFFVFPLANQITDLIKEKYGDLPEFLWEKLPEHGVFRNPQSQKWYAVILRIDKSKLDKSANGEVEILNIKLDDSEIEDLLKVKGFYPAYHMNKKSWISILLDGSVDENKIMNLLEKSHVFSEDKRKMKKG